MELNAVEAGETKETDAKVSVGSSCAGEWAAISQVRCPKRRTGRATAKPGLFRE
jgi:hypothetical protein